MMPLGNTILFVASFLVLTVGVVFAEISIVQRADGSTGPITHLDDNVGIYSDGHGNTGPAIAPKGPIPTGPHGDSSMGMTIPFGTLAPPNNLTPAPVLPMNPNRPLLPKQPFAPPPVAPPPGSGPSNSGRVGR